jgi:predicted ATPase
VIQSVEIKGLRGIREGRLDDLTPLVVLVGPNGSGKSTVLDALLIGSSPDPGDAIWSSVQRRSGLNRRARWLMWRGGEEFSPIIVVMTQEPTIRTCRLQLIGNSRNVIRCSIVVESVFGALQEQKRRAEGNVQVTFDNPTRGGSYSNSDVYQNNAIEIRLIEFGSETDQVPLHQLFTNAVERGRRGEVRGLISAVVPGLEDIEILTEGDTPIVYLVFKDHAVPAALSGDGIQTLIRLCLELASRPGGAVLLEDPEVHQHPGAIRQSARAILGAVRRDIQVIITTHSLELIDALLAETRDEAELKKFAVYRLQLRSGLLQSQRVAGPDVAFARGEIGDDLR